MLSPVTAANEVNCLTRQDVISSTLSQEIVVDSSAFFAPNDYAIVNAGTSLQEVVQLLAVNDSSHVSAIFRRNHSRGTRLVKVLSAISKTFRLKVSTVPHSAISKVSFHRVTDLPPGIHDQYRVVGSYTQGDDVPWISGANRYPRVPTEPVMLAGGPFTAVGVVAGSTIEIQWLLSFGADECQTDYRFRWEES